tara:strand:- start:342 stop:668 length:327 start_codon:yes stop_codon:yes gene_type:complete
MFNYMIEGQIFRAKRTFIDHCGKVLRTAKIINETAKPYIREEFGNVKGAQDFGGEFTVTVEEAITDASNVSLKLMTELAIALGATPEQLADCRTTFSKQGRVSITRKD